MKEVIELANVFANIVPWIVVAYTIHTVFSTKIKKIEIHLKDFTVKCEK